MDEGTLKMMIMNLQYITDNNGLTTGVFIPIEEWNSLKSKFRGIDQEEVNLPNWHKEIIRKRLELYKNAPEQALDFDTALDDIEKNL
jgi:hypothetical protein